MAKTKNILVRAEPELWRRAQLKAREDGITVSEMIRKFLKEWTRNI